MTQNRTKRNYWNNVPHENWQRVFNMRHNPTAAEKILWRSLRCNAVGVHFRRQHPIGPYIVDFCAPQLGLIIEVDGDTHVDDQARAKDEDRSAYLCAQGYRIKRYSNRDVMENLASVVGDIFVDCEK